MDTIPHALSSDPPGRPEQLARLIDHTLLRPEATAHDVAVACAEAAELGAFGVCVPPTRVRLARDLLTRAAAPVRLVAVVGFPSGTCRRSRLQRRLGRCRTATVGGRLGIKASGGIRTREQAARLIEAGATRLGLSATRQVLGR